MFVFTLYNLHFLSFSSTSYHPRSHKPMHSYSDPYKSISPKFKIMSKCKWQTKSSAIINPKSISYRSKLFSAKGKKIHHGDCGFFTEMTSFDVIFYRRASVQSSQWFQWDTRGLSSKKCPKGKKRSYFLNLEETEERQESLTFALYTSGGKRETQYLLGIHNKSFTLIMLP